MTTLTTTVLLAFLIIGAALALIGIGWLITGKSKIRGGACGRDPHQLRKDENCGNSSFSCQLCEKSGKKEPTKQEKPEDDQPIS